MCIVLAEIIRQQLPVLSNSNPSMDCSVENIVNMNEEKVVNIDEEKLKIQDMDSKLKITDLKNTNLKSKDSNNNKEVLNDKKIVGSKDSVCSELVIEAALWALVNLSYSETVATILGIIFLLFLLAI